jgi:YHS domain-containing protein
MTAIMRQTGKQILTLTLLAGLVCLGLPPMAEARAAGLVTTIVTDPLTGVALDGYDPVSYFTDPAPQFGKSDFEYDWAGVAWYFESAANRDVFILNPTVYAPQYGGHCVMSLSRGYLSDGNPQLFVIDKARLYLFYSTANRAAFLESVPGALAAAEANWPLLAKGLNGPSPSVAAAL